MLESLIEVLMLLLGGLELILKSGVY